MKYGSSLLAAFLMTTGAFAQSAAPMKTKALSFNINGLNLSGLNGGMGGKIWLEGNRALVGSIDAGYSYQVSNTNDTTYLDDESRNSTIGLSLGIEQHTDWAPGLSPYLMGGVFFNRSSSKDEGGIVGFPSQNTSWMVDFGARAGFGLEYWVAPRISIAGQQVLNAAYRIGGSNPNGPYMSDLHSFHVDLGTSSLILSVYL